MSAWTTWEQGWQWWEHSAPTNVARFESQYSHHMWVEFVVGFLPLLQEVFLQVFLFFPLHTNQHSQIPIQSGMHRKSTSFNEFLRTPKSSVGKQIMVNFCYNYSTAQSWQLF